MPPVKGYDGEKDTSMPIGLTTAKVCGLTQWAIVVFNKLHCYHISSPIP
jgi:hypothetical protein